MDYGFNIDYRVVLLGSQLRLRCYLQKLKRNLMFRRYLAISLASSLLGALVAAPAQAAEEASCANGGECVVGDIGPGGGVVFFVKTTGAFNASYTVSMDDGEGSFKDETVSVELSESEQQSLNFDYLEVAPVDGIGLTEWANGVDWSTTGFPIQDKKLGSGQSGTDAILGGYPLQNSSNNAAHYASSYSNLGKTDWFLPSMDELALVTIRHMSGAFGANNPIRDLMGIKDGACGTNFYGCTTTDMQTGTVVRIEESNWDKNYNVSSGSLYVAPIRAFSKIVEVDDGDSGQESEATTAKISKVSIKLATGSSALTKSHKASLRKLVTKAGKESKYQITGTAGRLPGVTDSKVRALAKARAEIVKGYLIKLGVKKSNIKIKTKIYNQGITPKTKILARYLLN